MFKKFGVNSTRQEKKGPTVTGGVSRPCSKRMSCKKCGKTFVKACQSELACEISPSTCPHCGECLE